MPGGGANARAAVELHCGLHPACGQCGLLTNMASAIAYFGVAAMKNADWDRLVVPVLAMTGWPLFSPRPAAVPPGWCRRQRPVHVRGLVGGEHLALR